MPKISVIVPVYNVERYLRQCIESMTGQTYTDIEIILIDDGSPDNCGAICDEYAAKDDRIVVLHQENGGISNARNAGLRIAKGEYIAFVDSDDYCYPDLFHELLTIIEEHDADLVLCKARDESRVYQRTKDCNGKVMQLSQPEYLKAFSDLLGAPWGRLFKADILSAHDIHFPLIEPGEDVLFNIRYAEHISKAVIVNTPLYFYRFVPGSSTKSIKPERYLSFIKNLDDVTQIYNRVAPQYTPLLNRRYVWLYEALEQICKERGEKVAAAHYLKQARCHARQAFMSCEVSLSIKVKLFIKVYLHGLFSLYKRIRAKALLARAER